MQKQNKNLKQLMTLKSCLYMYQHFFAHLIYGFETAFSLSVTHVP